jgi:hypothetical protein
MDSFYVKCAVCGNQLPASLVRDRGFITCSCGMRIDSIPGESRQHHLLRNFLFLFVTALLITLAATLGRRFLG